MSSSSNSPVTKSQAAHIYTKLKEKAANVPSDNEPFLTFIPIVQATLSFYPMKKNGDTPAIFPDSQEVLTCICDLLPTSTEIYTTEFFNLPAFPLKLLHSVASLYNCSDVPEDFLEAANMSMADRTDAIASAHAWLAHTLGLQPSDLRSIIARLRASRRSLPFMIINPTPISLHTTAPSVSTTDDAQIADDPTTRPYYSTAPILAKPTHPSTVQVNSQSQVTSEPHISLHRRNANNQSNSNGFEDTRKANYVSTQFSSRLFTGDISQSIALSLRDYEQCAKQHRLSDSQKAEYYINTLGNPARTFFLSKYQDRMSYEDITQFMLAEYNSNARQIQVRRTLQSLKLNSFSARNNVTTPAYGLTLLVTYIERLLPQCPPSFRGEDHKTAFLRSAVIGHQWARVPISNVDAGRLSFTAFVTELHASLSLESEVRETHPPLPTHLSEPTDVLYHRYGRDPRYVRKHDKNRRPTPYRPSYQPSQGANRSYNRSISEAHRRRECFKCSKPWVRGHHCDGPNLRNNIRDRIRQGESRTHIMSDLVLALESSLEYQNPVEDEADQNAHDHVDHSNVHHAQDEIYEFDDALINSSSQSDTENVDKDILTNIISHQMSAAPPSLSPDFEADFQ